jgi:small subunit ribosomal protein S20
MISLPLFMPILPSAIKKLKQDKRRTLTNKRYLATLKKSLKLVRAKKTPKNLSAAFQALDRAVKKHLIHKNRASRLKSRLMRH